MSFFGKEVTVEVLRPLGVVGVGIDVVVGEFLHVTSPKTPLVGKVVELDACVALSKLCVLESLGVVGSDWGEQQGKRGSNCCLAVDFGKHRAGC